MLNCFEALTSQALLEMKDKLQKCLGREPREAEIAKEINMSVAKVKRKIELERAARNKTYQGECNKTMLKRFLLLLRT